MEATGAVFGAVPCYSLGTKSRHFSRSMCCTKQSDQFSDKGHLGYYEMKDKKKEMKKKMKLLKGLSKNLSVFSEMGFGLSPDQGLDQQVKGHMISEASELLLAQLQKLRAEELELKKKKKEEKAKKKAARMRMKESSSSESSSESECERVGSSLLTLPVKAEKGGIEVEDVRSCSWKKIEVCMGGKCKKSGGAVLLENIQAAVGGDADAVVVGCKCMGKCRDGPNVRVRNEEVEEQVRNPLWIGVGLEDVDSIVTSFFGGNSPALSAA